MWNGKELVLILDHINGKNRDDRLDNLRWVCPNCNAQLETFGTRNIKFQEENGWVAYAVGALVWKTRGWWFDTILTHHFLLPHGTRFESSMTHQKDQNRGSTSFIFFSFSPDVAVGWNSFLYISEMYRNKRLFPKVSLLHLGLLLVFLHFSFLCFIKEVYKWI